MNIHRNQISIWTDYVRLLLQVLWPGMFVLSTLVLLAGCIIIPLPEHGLLKGRGAISESDGSFFQLGKTTREQVLLKFGEPDMVIHKQRYIVYSWEVSHGYWGVGGYGQGAGGPISKMYSLILEFDEQGYLKHFEREGSIFGSAQSKIDVLVGSQSEGMPQRGKAALLINPQPDKPAGAYIVPSLPAGTTFTINESTDLRSISGGDLLVGKMMEFGNIVAYVVVTRPPVDILRSTIITALEAAGQRLSVQGGDIVINAELLEFSVASSLGLISGDAVGMLDVKLETRDKQAMVSRRFHIRKTRSRLLGYHTEDEFEGVLRDCLVDMQQQIANDRELRRLFQPSMTK